MSDSAHRSPLLDSTLVAHRADYEVVTGRQFEHFFCPFLLRDEPAALCLGHVINEAFDGSDRRRVVQRGDVDHFYGTYFEEAFVALKERAKHSAFDVLASPRLTRTLKPKLLVDGKEVEHYRPGQEVAPQHTALFFEGASESVRLAIKLTRDEMAASTEKDWALIVSHDVRLPALVSLLKAAHLTLFSVIGYRWALSGGGSMMGRALGGFFMANRGKTKRQIRAAGEQCFREFAGLVRPVLKWPEGFQGSLTDGRMFLCTGRPIAWGVLVFVRTGEHMHAVIMPVLDHEDAGVRFANFLKAPSPRFEVRQVTYDAGTWKAAKDTFMFEWPASNYD